jgi:hypothetical protein
VDVALHDGDAARALAIAQRSLEITGKSLTPGHRFAVEALVSFGRAQLALERIADGEASLNEAVKRGGGDLGPAQLDALRDLAASALQRNALDQALGYAERGLGACQKKNPSVADRCVKLAVSKVEADLALGRIGQAAADADEADRQGATPGFDAPASRNPLLDAHASVLAAQNMPAEAVALRRQILATSTTDEDLRRARRALAGDLIRAGGPQALQEAQRLLEKSEPSAADSAEGAEQNLALARLAQRSGDAAAARQHAQRTSAYWGKHRPAHEKEYLEAQRLLQELA